MKMTVWVAAFLMIVVPTGACAASEVSNASLHKLLVLSGIEKMTQQMPAMVKAGLEQAKRETEQQARAANKKPALSDDDFNALGNAAASAFKPDDILRAIAKQVRPHVSEQDARKMLIWYNSSIGKRINKAEEDADTPKAYQQMLASAKQSLADEQRVQFARELDKVEDQTGLTMKLQEENALAMFVAFSSVSHPDRPVDIKAIRQKIEASLQKMRPRFEQMTIISTVYTYRNIDMAKLRKYLAFLKQPCSMRFNKSAKAGLVVGSSQAMGRLAKAAASIAKSKHPHKS